MTYTEMGRKFKLTRTVLVKLIESHYGHLPEYSEEVYTKVAELIKANPPKKVQKYDKDQYWKTYDELLKKGYLTYKDLRRLIPGKKSNYKSIMDNMAKNRYRDGRFMLIYEDEIDKISVIRPFSKDLI